MFDMLMHGVNRVPPFLQTIHEPCVMQCRSFKVCPVCRDKVILVPLTCGVHISFKSQLWHLKLSQAGGHTALTDGITEGCECWWGWILVVVVGSSLSSTLCCHIISLYFIIVVIVLWYSALCNSLR